MDGLNFLNSLLRLLYLSAIAIFVWGIIEFIWNAANEEKRQTGKRHIIWGLIGLFIMLAVTGIIQLIKNSLGVE